MPRRQALVLLTAAVAALVVMLPGLGATPLDDPGEGQHAEIARELLAGGEVGALRLNGVRYYDKPPLLYWLTAAAFAGLGPTEWAARLAPALGAVLAVMATALLGYRLLGPFWGLAAAGCLLTSTLFLAFGRYLRPETLFAAAIQWGLTGFLLADLAPDAPRAAAARWRLAGCAALGLASLVKDPIGLIGPLAALAVARALCGRLRPVSGWLPWGGVALLVALGAGWYALASAQNPRFLWYAVVDNHLLNAVRLRHFPDEDVPLSAFEFLGVSSLGAFPWTVPAVFAAVSMLRRRAWRDPAELPWVALLLWAGGVFALFAAIPFKLPHYGLPAYPALALLAARGWQERGRRARGLIALHAVLFGALALGCAMAAAGDGRWFSDLVFSATDVYTRKEAVLGEAGSLPSWMALRPLVARAGLVLGLTAFALAAAFVRGGARLGLAVTLAGMLALTPVVESALALVASGRAVAAMAAEVRRVMRPGDLLVHEGPIENSGALEFYSGHRPALLDARRSVLGIGATFADSRDIFWDRERFRREWLAGDRRVWLVTPRSAAESATATLPPGTVRARARLNGRTLYENAMDR